MSRSKHVDLAQSETALSRGRHFGTLARRAWIEQELRDAIASNDARRASELHAVLAETARIGRRGHGVAGRRRTS